MNKELIKKYKNEFDHWLADGKILVKYSNPKEAIEGYEDWHKDEEVFNSNLEYKIIINDEYAEFRKALAEGKTIQYKCNLGTCGEEWSDVTTMTPSSSYDRMSLYRLKPDEPKFKVGDWVTQAGSKTFQFTENTCYLGLEPWKPQPGEMVWVWDSYYKFPIFGKFHSIDDGQYCVETYLGGEFMWLNHCEPFLGELPRMLKDI